MMRGFVLLLLLLGACTSQPGTSSRSEGDRTPDRPVGNGLVGLYEGNPAAGPNQLCIVERGGAKRFGLVVWGANRHSCSGSGTVERTGDRLVLAMGGDSPCTIHATLDGAKLAIDEKVPESCAYYCGARARLGGAAFTRTASGEAAALRARDLVGEPLCGR